jgi:prolipoprotein diacylglyceryltransferase
MWPVIFNLGKFGITWWVVYLILAILWSSFILWKRLREDYPDEEIFSFNVILVFMVMAGALAGGWLEWGKIGAISGWGMVITGVSALWQWCNKKKWDFWEMADFLAILSLWMWFLGSLAWGPAAKWGVISAAVGILVISLIKNNYKKIRWYKSGKVGLTGLMAICYFSVVQISLAMVVQPKVYWDGLTASQWVSSWTVAFGLVGIYLRAGRKLREERIFLLFKRKT